MEQNNTPSRNPRRRTPFQRNRRLQGEWLATLLVGCVLAFTVLGFVTPDKDISENENRSLTLCLVITTVIKGVNIFVVDVLKLYYIR